MFTAIMTVTHDNGVMTTISDGYAASGADELNDFVLELVTRARVTAQNAGRGVTGFTLVLAIS